MGPPQLHRFLEQCPGTLQVLRPERVEAEMPRCIRASQGSTGLVRALQSRDGAPPIAAHDLVNTPHPEGGEGLPLHLAEPVIEPSGALEVGELTRILNTVHEEASVRDPPPSHGKVRLGRIKVTVGEIELRRVTPERCQLVALGSSGHAVISHPSSLGAAGRRFLRPFADFEYVGAPVKADVGWQAWVVYVVVAEDEEVTTVQQWVSKHLVRPA